MIFLYLFVAVDIEPGQMASTRGKDLECSLRNKRTGIILCDDNKCWALLVLRPWIWPPFNSLYGRLSTCFFFSSSCLVANLFWLRIYLSPHVDILSYCIKKNTGESKQASIFQQVTRQRSPTQISKKRRGVGSRMENRYIYKGEKNPPSFLGPSQILNCGYYSQLLVIPRTAKGDSWSNYSCYVILWSHANILISLIISECNNKENNAALKTVSTVSPGDRFALVYKFPKGKLRLCKLKKKKTEPVTTNSVVLFDFPKHMSISAL